MERGIGGVTFENIAENLRTKDQYMVLADFDSYMNARIKAEKLYNDPQKWNSMCAVNIAQAGRFASDRSIREYAENIWGANPLPQKEAPAAAPVIAAETPVKEEPVAEEAKPAEKKPATKRSTTTKRASTKAAAATKRSTTTAAKKPTTKTEA